MRQNSVCHMTVLKILPQDYLPARSFILFVLLLYIPVNSYGHGGTVSSPNHTFSWASQGSKIVLVRSYLRVPQAAGQVKILLILVEFKFPPIHANNFCDAGQVPILRYFEACKLEQVVNQ